MRVLLVSYFFPPYNAIGAVRNGKTAKYLVEFGHDVRVLTAADQPLQPTLPLEIPEGSVTYTRAIDTHRPAAWLLGGRKRVKERGYTPPSPGVLRWGFNHLRSLYQSLLVPDAQIGWYPFAVRAGARLVEQWRPDVIYASALPLTSLLVARKLADRFGIPWVGELRDLWADNHYADHPAWRRPVDAALERRVLSGAAGLVTVTEPWADLLAEKFGKPTAVVTNGFDPSDFPSVEPPGGDAPLRVVYTGMIYPGRRDPSPLFAALRDLGPDRERIRVAFYGRYMDVVQRIASDHDVAHLVDVHHQLPYEDSLRVQAGADVLLLLMWDDPRERSLIPGKVFEYIGARRPILGIGPQEGVVAEMLHGRELGVMLRSPQEIRDALRGWLRQRDAEGAVPLLPRERAAGLTREEQTRRLEGFLSRACSAP